MIASNWNENVWETFIDDGINFSIYYLFMIQSPMNHKITYKFNNDTARSIEPHYSLVK